MMTREQCEENIREYGSSGFEGWVDCMDNYPELDDIIYDELGGDLPDTTIISSKNPFIPAFISENQNFKRYYIIGGIILLILLAYFLINKK
jgi:hypothetical protein